MTDNDDYTKGLGDLRDFRHIPHDNPTATDVEPTVLGHMQAYYLQMTPQMTYPICFVSIPTAARFVPITAPVQCYGRTKDGGLMNATVAAPATHNTQIKTFDGNAINGVVAEHAHLNYQSYGNTATGHTTRQSPY